MISTRILLSVCLLAIGSFAQQSWTQRNPGTVQPLQGVAWMGTQLVAVGNRGAVLTSPDAITWTSRSPGTSRGLLGVAWNGSLLVAVGDSGTILTSANGINWTARSSTATAAGTSIMGVTWAGSRWVMTSFDTLRTSQDGTNWTTVKSIPTSNCYSVAWTGTQWVAVGRASKVLRTSDNGATWGSVSGISGNRDLYSVMWTGSQLVAVGASGLILTSPDGSVWAERNSGTTQTLYGVTGSSSQLVAMGTGVLLTSTDGITWIQRVSTASLLLAGGAPTGSQFVVVGSDGGNTGTVFTAPQSGTGILLQWKTGHSPAWHSPGAYMLLKGIYSADGRKPTLGFPR